MTTKFDSLYNEEYRRLFSEDAPLPINPDADKTKSPEHTAEVSDVPAVPNQAPEVPPQEIPQDGDSQLPDPRAQERVGIDTLNSMIELFQRSPDEQKNIIDQLKQLAGGEGINTSNFKDALSIIKNITPDKTI